MNAKERFESMMLFIEERVTEPDLFGTYPGHVEINYALSRKLAVGFRSLNDTFRFLTDISLTQYVKERKIMCAYKNIIDKGSYSMNDCLSMTGYETPSSFNKAFKDRFGCSPTEAAHNKDGSKYKEMLTWDDLSGIQNQEPAIPKTQSGQIKFGIDTGMLRKYEEAADLQAIYEMNDFDSEIAFLLSDHYKIPLKDAFDIMDIEEKCGFIFDNHTIDEEWEAEEFAAIITRDDVDTFYLWNVLGDTEINETREILSALKKRGIDNVQSIDKRFLDAYKKYQIEIPLIIDLYNAYHSDPRFKAIGLEALVEFVRDNDYYEAEGVLDDYCKWEDSVIESAMDPITYEEELEIILDGMAHERGEEY